MVGGEILVYVTNFNCIYRRDLGLGDAQEVIYANQQTKSLVKDHYIHLLYYHKHCNKLFAVSQLRPDLQYQESLETQSSTSAQSGTN